MDIKLAKIIENLGLEQKESRVYLAALELGGGSVVEIARKANIERVNTYSVLDGMVKKGLVSVLEKKRGKKYSVISPESLKDLAKSRFEALERALPALITIENSLEKKPKIRYYEGIEGLKQAYSETLRERGEEILVIAPGVEVYEYMGEEWIKSYLAKRIKRGITVRGIAPVSDYSMAHQSNDSQELRKSRLVPAEKFYFKNEINIFNNKVMIASYRDQMGVIIESQDVADTQRAFFELAWEGARNYT